MNRNNLPLVTTIRLNKYQSPRQELALPAGESNDDPESRIKYHITIMASNRDNTLHAISLPPRHRSTPYLSIAVSRGIEAHVNSSAGLHSMEPPATERNDNHDTPNTQ